MKLDVPTGSTYYWNPYSPKFYTLVSPTSSVGTPRDATNSSSLPMATVRNGSLTGSSNSFQFSGTTSDCGASDSAIDEHSLGALDDEEYDLGWSTISAVRTETTDANIQAAVQRLPIRTLSSMLAVLENSPNLVTELCEKERGNVVSHVMLALGAEQCQQLVNFTVANALNLATNQSGCIAFSRIYDAATAVQQDELKMSVLVHFESLVMHQYGNFVLNRLLQDRDEAIFGYVAGYFEDVTLLLECIENKFGSHVFEKFVKNAPAHHLFPVAATLFSSPENVLALATSRIANYPLQATLRQMLLLDSQHDVSRWALENIPIIVADTKFAPNINRALGFRPTNNIDERAQQQGHPRSPKHRPCHKPM